MLIALTVAGVLGNYLTAPLFFGVDFLFGSIAVLMVVQLYGVRWGLLAALVATLHTYFLWGHAAAIVIFSMEALLIGVAPRPLRNNLLLAAGAFWLVCGMPLVWVLYRHLLDMPTAATLVVMLKQSVNGMFNALIASLLLTYVPLWRWAGLPQPPSVPLNRVLFQLLTAAVMIPSLLLIVVNGRSERQRIEREVRQQLDNTASGAAQYLQSWQKRHIHAVKVVADSARNAGLRWTPRLQESADAIRHTFPDFHNLYVADSAAVTYMFSPTVNLRGEPTVGLHFADRAYYRELQRTRQPVFTDVFEARGGVFVPIVGIGVPILVNDEFQGYALGAVDLRELSDQISAYFDSSTIYATLVDANQQVIASTWPQYQPMDHFDRHQGGELTPVAPNTFHWAPLEPHMPEMTRWQESFYIRRTAEGIAPWTLIIEAPVAPHQQYLNERYVYGLASVLGLSLVALIAATIVSGRLSDPLRRLALTTSNLPDRLVDQHPVAWPRSGVTEVASLVANFQTMLDALTAQFSTLTTTNRDLADANQSLEQQIDERRKAEDALRMSESRFRTVVEQSPLGIQIFAPSGQLLQVNQAWLQFWNVNPARLAGYNVLQDAELEAQGVLPAVQRAFAGELTSTGPFPYRPLASGNSGEARWVEAHFYPITHEGGIREVVMLLQDVTERRNVERERARLLAREREARAEAEQLYAEAQENARRKDEFLAMLAHELRNPLGAVSNAIHVLRRAGSETPSGRRALDVLDRQVRHQRRLVDDLLDVSRITRGLIALRPEPTDLTRLVSDTATDYRPVLEQTGLQLELSIPKHPVVALVDPTRMMQVVSNLLHNAQKFTPQGGTVRVTLETEPTGQTACISVEDTGIGIDPALMERLFEPFSQGDGSLDRSRGGLGLGLALVRGIVELHHGTVTAYSAGPHQGSRFTLRIPISPSDQQANVAERRTPANPASPPPRSPTRVLVIDDNPDVAESLRDLLDLYGCEVEVAQTGRQGLETARRFRPELVLCDIGLPELDGYEVARELRKLPETAQAWLVAVTGYGRDADRQKALEAGFDQHLTKPIEPEWIRKLVQTHEATRNGQTEAETGPASASRRTGQS